MLVEALAVVAVLIVLAVTVLAVKLRAPPTFAPGPPKVCRTCRIVAYTLLKGCCRLRSGWGTWVPFYLLFAMGLHTRLHMAICRSMAV